MNNISFTDSGQTLGHAETASVALGDLDGDLDSVRNGYQGIRVSFRLKGNASDEELAGLLAQSKARSAVFDIVTNGVPVDIQVRPEGA